MKLVGTSRLFACVSKTIITSALSVNLFLKKKKNAAHTWTNIVRNAIDCIIRFMLSTCDSIYDMTISNAMLSSVMDLAISWRSCIDPFGVDNWKMLKFAQFRCLCVCPLRDLLFFVQNSQEFKFIQYIYLNYCVSKITKCERQENKTQFNSVLTILEMLLCYLRMVDTVPNHSIHLECDDLCWSMTWWIQWTKPKLAPQLPTTRVVWLF